MKQAVESQGIVVMKADKTDPSPEIDNLLIEFGNAATAIPYYAVYRPNEEPVHFDGNFLSPKGFMAKAGISIDANPAKLNRVEGTDSANTTIANPKPAVLSTDQP